MEHCSTETSVLKIEILYRYGVEMWLFDLIHSTFHFYHNIEIFRKKHYFLCSIQIIRESENCFLLIYLIY